MSDTDSMSTLRFEDEAEDPDASNELPRLIVALECWNPRVAGMRISLGAAAEVTIGRGPHRRVERSGRHVEITIGDAAVSRRHACLRRVVGGWAVSDLGSTNGIVINGEPCTRAHLADGDLIEVGSTMILFRDVGAARRRVHGPIDRDLAGESDARALLALRTLSLDLEGLMFDLARIGRSQVSVLVQGETGTGKELIARMLHALSDRRGQFVPINCGALPRTLIESELFGYRRGAFSGASEERDGLIRRAHGGTLFLDEVAELPAESQVALLRVLQEAEVRPIGAGDLHTVDVRVIAATHQDIPKRIAEGQFRRDLYARLAGFELTVPPLRDRREDVGSLIAAIMRRIGSDAARVTLHRSAARALLSYSYPLNIRELEQALRTAVVFADGGQIRLEHLPEAIRAGRPTSVLHLRPEDSALRERLLDTLRLARGNVAEAGRVLNKAPIQIRRWCQRFGIDVASFREREVRLREAAERPADPEEAGAEGPEASDGEADDGAVGTN